LPIVILPINLTCGLLVVVGVACLAAERRDFPSIDLRGYGRVEGSARDLPASSVLRVRCESTAKAALLRAKYISDLALLPGTAATVVQARGVSIPTVTAGHQGVMTAGRDGRTMFIFAAESADTLTTLLLEELKGKPDELEFRETANVPMYLDCWDKYGFRFYYRPWETPGKTKWADDNALEEFDFAKRLGDLGFVFWAKPEDTDTGPAVTNWQWWEWAARAAQRRDLPVTINTVHTAPTWLLNAYRDQVMAKMPQYCGSYHSIADPSHDGGRQISWCATGARDAQYAIVQEHVRETSQWLNTIDYMEPNCELKHGAYDVLIEYGPAADDSYRGFLRDRYGSPRRLSERWHGDTRTLRSWDDVCACPSWHRSSAGDRTPST